MVIPSVHNWFDAVIVSLTGGMVTLLSFVPALIGAVLILIIGWVLSGIVARLVAGLLDKAGFERAAQRAGVSDFISRAGAQQMTASRVIGELVKWFIRLIFLEAAAEALHLSAVTQVINSIVLFIPNLVVALIVLMVGALIARFVAGLVRGSASEAGFENPGLLARVAQGAIIAFAVIIAVNQIGVASTLINTLFMGLVGAVALALGLAFGLGGRDVAGQIWKQWYGRGQEMAPRLESAAQAAAQPAASPAQQSQPAAPDEGHNRRAATTGRTLRPTAE